MCPCVYCVRTLECVYFSENQREGMCVCLCVQFSYYPETVRIRFTHEIKVTYKNREKYTSVLCVLCLPQGIVNIYSITTV